MTLACTETARETVERTMSIVQAEEIDPAKDTGHETKRSSRIIGDVVVIKS